MGTAWVTLSTSVKLSQELFLGTILRRLLILVSRYGYWRVVMQVKDAVLEEYNDLLGKFSNEFKQTRCMIEDEGKKLTQGKETVPEKKEWVGPARNILRLFGLISLISSVPSRFLHLPKSSFSLLGVISWLRFLLLAQFDHHAQSWFLLLLLSDFCSVSLVDVLAISSVITEQSSVITNPAVLSALLWTFTLFYSRFPGFPNRFGKQLI